jgi:hypothetical protein
MGFNSPRDWCAFDKEARRRTSVVTLSWSA